MVQRDVVWLLGSLMLADDLVLMVESAEDS